MLMTSSLEQCLLTKVHHWQALRAFSLCTHAEGFFTRVLCLRILCLQLSCFMWKGEGVGCLLPSLVLWYKNSFIPQMPTDHPCFNANICCSSFSRFIVTTVKTSTATTTNNNDNNYDNNKYIYITIIILNCPAIL